MVVKLRQRNDRDGLSAKKGRVWSQPATAFSVSNHNLVAVRDGWDGFLVYWPLRARETLISKNPPQPVPTRPSVSAKVSR